MDDIMVKKSIPAIPETSTREQPDGVWLWGLGSTAEELQREWVALAGGERIARLSRQPIHVSSSEAQPQTTARKGTWFSVNKKPAELSASLRRPLRVATIYKMGSLFGRKSRSFET